MAFIHDHSNDEVILQDQALLASFGMNANEIKTTMTATLDLAAGKQISLRTATELLGKAVQDNGPMLLLLSVLTKKIAIWDQQ